jgi:hypothetical protein
MNGIGHGCFWLNKSGRHLADLQKDAVEIASPLREMGKALKSA